MDKYDEMLAPWRSLGRTYAMVLRAVGREMERTLGLSLPWWEVLVRLARAPEGRMRMRELADSVVFSRSGITRLVDRMAAAGLVERQQCSRDRRGWYAAITEAGQSVLKRARPVHHRGIQQHFLRHLTEEDKSVLQTICGKVLQVEYREPCHRPEPPPHAVPGAGAEKMAEAVSQALL